MIVFRISSWSGCFFLYYSRWCYTGTKSHRYDEVCNEVIEKPVKHPYEPTMISLCFTIFTLLFSPLFNTWFSQRQKSLLSFAAVDVGSISSKLVIACQSKRHTHTQNQKERHQITRLPIWNGNIWKNDIFMFIQFFFQHKKTRNTRCFCRVWPLIIASAMALLSLLFTFLIRCHGDGDGVAGGVSVCDDCLTVSGAGRSSVNGIYRKATPNAAHSWIDTSKLDMFNWLRFNRF